jgi:hypothetical protein
VKVIYKITYPNGKIYVGKDLTDTLNYFGSADSRLIEADYTREEQRDFSIRRGVLWESETATDAEVNVKEVEYIEALRPNDPAVGYNRWPKFRRTFSGADPSDGEMAPATVPLVARQAGEGEGDGAGAGGSAVHGLGGVISDFGL